MSDPKYSYERGYAWYWNNYQRTMDWLKKHRLAMQTAEEHAQNYIQTCLRESIKVKEQRTCGKCHRYKRYHQHMSYDKTTRYNEECDESSESDFEITEEMLEFFKITRKHREELKIKREKEKEKLDKIEFINLENYQDNRKTERTSLPPNEQPGLENAQRMELLYGKAAPKIMGMETSIQLNFDRHYDLNQPKLWPNIPIKI